MSDLVAVIMAGGVGTRFWPMSTPERPKQFLALVGDRTLLQESYDRVVELTGPDRILVVTGQRYQSLVAEQLPRLQPSHILGEPFRRDTAAAVALAALVGRKLFGNPILAVLTADHWIRPVPQFHRALLSAARQARERDAIYTFGIRPRRPAVSYGYVEMGPAVFEDEGLSHHRLLGFHEKPDLKTAVGYVDSGRHCWNSGMFVFSADRILRALQRHLPAHLELLAPAVDAFGTAGWKQALRHAFEAMAPISIDYGVMEKAEEIWSVVAEFDWSDLGGWLALESFLPQRGGNRVHGRTAVLSAEENLVFCEDPEELVALLGVQDLIVVRSWGRTLVARRDRIEELKKLVEDLCP
ncbi:MAG: NTP transferase domain-containing protein [Armatimonadetes bacterium]|nr:NTP transferase domain-containing protein [Armatimonadota bacterium]